ncbi:MAG: hypothetical protein ABIV10_01885 [Gemmatimonadaceae bacterium]
MLDRQEYDVGRGGTWNAGQSLYSRPMPGGGYVRVDVVASNRGDAARARRLGRVVIEPRDAARRRDGSALLVVEEIEGDDEQAVVAECFRIARDNAAIARRVLRRRLQAGRFD